MESTVTDNEFTTLCPCSAAHILKLCAHHWKCCYNREVGRSMHPLSQMNTLRVYYYVSKPWVNSVYIFLNFPFYLKMGVCPKQKIPTLEHAMHIFLRIKLKTLKRKEKHNLSWLSNDQLRLQIPGDPYSFSSGIRALWTEKSEKKC